MFCCFLLYYYYQTLCYPLSFVIHLPHISLSNFLNVSHIMSHFSHPSIVPITLGTTPQPMAGSPKSPGTTSVPPPPSSPGSGSPAALLLILTFSLYITCSFSAQGSDLLFLLHTLWALLGYV